MIEITIPGECTGKGRPRFGKGRVYTDAKTKSYEELVAWHGKIVMKQQLPLTGPLDVQLLFSIAMPEKRLYRKAMAGIDGTLHPVSGFDLDNLCKSILDGLNGICYLDDKQIVALTARKFYAETAQVKVWIKEI